MVTDNLVRLIESSVKSNWDLPAMTDYSDKITVTYSEMAKKIAWLHVAFSAMGLEKGDRVALCGKNGINWGITYLATITYGAVIVPILQDFNPSDIEHIINHSDAKLLVTSENIWSNLQEDSLLYIIGALSLKDFSLFYAKPEEYSEAEKESRIQQELPIDGGKEPKLQRVMNEMDRLMAETYPNGFGKADVLYPTIPNSELACISYTSGTTGYSKGVMLSHNALAGNIQFGISTHLEFPGCRVLSFLPLAHVFGCTYDFLCNMCCGGQTYFLGKVPSPKILLQALAEVKPHMIFSVPLVIEKIYSKVIRPMLETRGMKWALQIPLIDNQILAQINKKLTEALGGEFTEVIVGGAPMNPEAENFFKKIGFRFTVGYGMTECAPLISYTKPQEYKINSVGKLLPNMEAKIDSLDPQNEVGEILVRGENVMMGYYKNEEATKAVLDEDGWLHTGDMGTMDYDGTLYIRGRNKNMLLGPSGQNIYPEEIEAKLNNMPYVLESLVIQMSDNRLMALVVPDYQMVDAAKMSHADVKNVMEENRKALNALTASYESIAVIKVHPNEFEKTPKKSIKRFLYTGLGKI